MTTRTRSSWRRVAAASLALVLAASACEAAPQPKGTSDVANANELALEAAYLLLRLSAYDYALAGTLTGARTHVVSIPRYSSVVRDSAANIQRFTGNALGATLDASGPVRDRVVTLADTLVDVSRSSTRYADGRDPAAFAEVVGGVRQAWQDVDSLARLVRPADPDLLATIKRGSSFLVAATPGKVYPLTVGAFASSAEANDAARRIGTVEGVSTEAPFVVRVGTYSDRAAGEAEMAKLSVKGFTGVLGEEERYRFGRSGPVPDAELWREPERVFDTQGGARRVAIASKAAYVVAGSDDGSVAIFTGDGVLRQLPRLLAGIAILVFNDDGYWVMGGGITLRNFLLPAPGGPQGEPVVMPTPTSEIVYVPGANYFAAVAKGNGGGGVIAGRSPDGVRLVDPFPIRVPDAGAAIAANGWGQLFFATSEAGTTQINVVIDRNVHGVLRLPGNVSDLVMDREGTHGAVMTDQGVYRFAPRSTDPSGSLRRVGDPVRQIGIGADGTLYLMTQTKITALEPSGEVDWTSALVDGRRLVVADRPVVLDGADRLLTFSPGGIVEDLGTSGTILDVAASPDGRHIAVLADGSAQIFRLP